MDATSGAVCGKRQASSLELLDAQQAEPVQSQSLPTPAHISTASEATLRSSMAAAAAFPIVSQTFSEPYDASAVQHPLFTGAWTHPHVHMSYNTQAPSSSYLSAPQMVHVPGTASAMPHFPGTLRNQAMVTASKALFSILSFLTQILHLQVPWCQRCRTLPPYNSKYKACNNSYKLIRKNF